MEGKCGDHVVCVAVLRTTPGKWLQNWLTNISNISTVFNSCSQKYLTWSDPHPDKQFCYSFRHTVWRYTWHSDNFWSCLAFYLTYFVDHLWHIYIYIRYILTSFLPFYLTWYVLKFQHSLFAMCLGPWPTAHVHWRSCTVKFWGPSPGEIGEMPVVGASCFGCLWVSPQWLLFDIST